MPSGIAYPIEDFLEAITAQLDQTQDALRLKAVNRPLTFALKDFNVDLKVFVEMDNQGRVTFRPSGPNEEGASTVSIGFTTITRPMIEENTISMEMSQAPSLDELGLKSSEQRQLAKIGVRNGAQLRNLQRSAGEDTLSRHTGVDLSRIRSALDLARPRLDDVVADGVKGTPHAGPAPGLGPTNGGRPNVPEPAAPVRPMPDEPASAGPLPRDQNQPDRVAASPGGGNLADRLRSGVVARPGMGAHQPRRLQIDPNTRNIRLEGRNLIDAGRAPSARLDGRPLSLLDANTHSASFSLPPGRGSGILTIELPDGATEEFQLIQPTDGPT